MPKSTRTVPTPLARAAQRFEKWRRSRTKREIPERLWNLATKLGGKYGVNRTAQALRLGYHDLKRRVEVADLAGAGPGPKTAATFVEVLPSRGGECVVEIEDRQGTKMTIRLSGPIDVVALTRSFLEKRR
jgi:hypothetical protein